MCGLPGVVESTMVCKKIGTQPVAASLRVGLRMVCTSLPKSEPVRYEEAAEMIAVLRAKETDYTCGDYFHRHEEEHERRIGRPGSCLNYEPMDVDCRQIMCDWCYTVCNIYGQHWSREVVAIAFSYLDRFMDRQPFRCDRASFRLAAVTSFYLATKIMWSKHLSIDSLCLLGCGHFTNDQIKGMEIIMLTALDWRVNPPTAMATIALLRRMFPTSVSPIVTEAIIQHAIFFAELSVYDAYFISASSYLVAVTSIITGMEYLEHMRGVNYHEKGKFHGFLSVVCVGMDQDSIFEAKEHLWRLYHNSAQGIEEKWMALDSFECRPPSPW